MASSLILGVPRRLPPTLVADLRKDPDIVDWLISVTENEETKENYVRQVGKFLLWTNWTVQDIFRIKEEALRNGHPMSDVETKIKRFMEALREEEEYSGKYRAFTLAAIGSLLNSKGFPLKRKLVRIDASSKLEMRVPELGEVERFVEYASTLEKKLFFTALTDTPCRPRVHTAIRWNWLEEHWWEKDFVHVSLPREFRPSPQSGPCKFEPICFLGPKTIGLLKQHRQAKINAGKVPLETDRILTINYDGGLATVRRDFDDLVKLGLVRPSRKDPEGKPLEQPISPKSWRKYQFNVIDSLRDIAPEWRKMLKGRDLDTEKYYSKENIEGLRKVYREKIYPQLWSDGSVGQSAEDVKSMREEIQELSNALHMVQDELRTRIGPQEVKA
jgi:hypothetical protein